MSILDIERVGKSFSGSRKGEAPFFAVRDLSLAVAEGEFVCLLGRSGCGKSTLLSIVAGLLPPDSGRVVCRDELVAGPSRHRMLMFQDAALFPWLDVLGNVLYGLKLAEDLAPAQKMERARAFLDLVGLGDFVHYRIHELSGGMRQRVALARALAPDPDILLMDEPFSALDAMTREQLYADMQRIWLETGKTVLMVTHNVREAVCLGSRIILMESPGRLVADEAVDLPYPRNMNDVGLAVKSGFISSLMPAAGSGGGAS